MAFKITTTGTQDPLVLKDLGGRAFDHPTTNFDLETEFSRSEIAASQSVQDAIDSGYMTATDGNGNPIIDAQAVVMIPRYDTIFHANLGGYGWNIYGYIQSNSTHYAPIGTFRFKGTNVHTPKKWVVLCEATTALYIAYMRLYDLDNTQEVAYLTKNTVTKEILKADLSHLPEKEAMFEVQVMVSDGFKNIRIYEQALD